MKVSPNIQTLRTCHVPLVSLQMSNLVASEIMTHTDVGSRAGSIEKWLAVADICRCLNNYNGVLEITSALNRSAIYRLKKTWAKVCKQVAYLQRTDGIQTRPLCREPYCACVFSDEGSDGQAAEDGVIRGSVQKPQRDAEEVNTATHNVTNVSV